MSVEQKIRRTQTNWCYLNKQQQKFFLWVNEENKGQEMHTHIIVMKLLKRNQLSDHVYQVENFQYNIYLHFL